MKTFCFFAIIIILAASLGAHLAKDGEHRADWDAGVGIVGFIVWMLLLWGAGLFDNL